MPTQKPRIAVTLDPQVDATLDRLAEAMGKPKATFVADLLLEMVPQFDGLAKIAKAAKAGNKVAAKRALRHLMGDAFAEAVALTQPDLYPPAAKRTR